MKKLNAMTTNLAINGEMIMWNVKEKLGKKLKENSGADGSTEKSAWIIAALVIGGAVIFLIKKFAPEIGNMVMDKIKEFFSQATVS